MITCKSKIMKKGYTIGVDVSKLTLDLYCFEKSSSTVVTNDPKGFACLLRWIKKQLTPHLSEVMLVMEYTGIYTHGLEAFLSSRDIVYVKRPALDIKRSLGIRRGKNDRADARLISQYGWYRKGELQPSKPLAKAQMDLKQLTTYLDKLVKDRASYQTRLKELKGCMGGSLHPEVLSSTEWVLEVLASQIKAIKKSIEELLAHNEDLKASYALVSSVKGVGFTVAVHLLVVTENFSRFTQARKFACYSGVAPFEYSSGTSIRAGTHVSPLANKKIKSLLTLSALSAVRHDPELKTKYEQKLREGKAKMSALNMIRFKLLERIFSVIHRQSPYVLKQAA